MLLMQMVPCYGNLVVLRELSTQLHHVNDSPLSHQFRDVCTVFNVMREMMEKTGARKIWHVSSGDAFCVGMAGDAQAVFEHCAESESLYQGN